MPLVALPHESVALQLRSMILVPPQLLLTESVNVTVTDPQPSWEVAMRVLLVVVLAGHSSVKLAGRIKLGGMVSRTVMVCVALVLLPHASVAVHLRAMTLVLRQLVVITSL